MKIIPHRPMMLGGQHVERAKPVEVSDADGELAIRHGWAVKAKGKAPAKPAGEQASAGGNDDAAGKEGGE